MNKQNQTAFKTFYVDFNAIIELCAGFEDFFKKYPKKEKCFPRCNAYKKSEYFKIRKKADGITKNDSKKVWSNGYKSCRCTKSRKMFIGKKTECFEKLLKTISVEVDSKFLESEYYFTPFGEGNIYSYVNEECAIYFDFYIEPTAQIEACAISVLYPKEKEQKVINAISEIHNKCLCVEKKIYDDDLTQFIRRNKKRIIDCNNKLYKTLMIIKNRYM